MTALLTELRAQGVELSVTRSGGLGYKLPAGIQPAPILATLREHKAELLEQLKAANDTQDSLWMAKARAKVIADLRAHPGIRYAAEVDASGNPVRIMLAIRDVGSCVLTIDPGRWDLAGFIALMDRRAGLGLGVAA